MSKTSIRPAFITKVIPDSIPNAPEQNPLEDICLKTKKLITTFDNLCSFLKIVKWLFNFFVDGQIFDFPKLFQYENLPQPIGGLLY